MKLPLAVSLQSRDGTLAKDSKLVNAIIDAKDVEKRPGTEREYDSTEVGTGGALLCRNSALFAVVNDKLIAL